MARYSTETCLAADVHAFGPGTILTPEGHGTDEWIASVKGTKKTPGRKTGILELEFANGEVRSYRLSGEGGVAAAIANGSFKVDGDQIRLSKEAKTSFKQKLEEVGPDSALHRKEFLEDAGE